LVNRHGVAFALRYRRGHDLLTQAPALHGSTGLLLRKNAEGVLVLARDAAPLRHVLGRLPQRSVWPSASGWGCGERQPGVESALDGTPRAYASLGFSITSGPRVMLSTPPATNSSPWPLQMACAAAFTACSPLPHRRLTV